MIKASDVRIGNWILSWEHGGQGKPARITPSNIKTLFELEQGMEYAALKAIPLTAAILEKSGFKRDYRISELNYYEYKQLSLWESQEKKGIFTKKADGNFQIFTVHQLQNLYHALTLEELEINL